MTSSSYFHWIKLLAARNCFNSGAKVADIAKQAKVHPSTIRRWLKATRSF